ncbi:unnamed protein product, partial [Effrenium voratum]
MAGIEELCESERAQLAELRAELAQVRWEAAAGRQAHRAELEELAAVSAELQEAVQPKKALGEKELAESQARLSELHTELLLAQAEAEFHGGVQPRWQASCDEAGCAALAEAQAKSEALEIRHSQAELALELAKKRVQSYEDWCQALHVELRSAGAELAAERQASQLQRAQLRRRAAELAGRGGSGAMAVAQQWLQQAPKAQVAVATDVVKRPNSKSIDTSSLPMSLAALARL